VGRLNARNEAMAELDALVTRVIAIDHELGLSPTIADALREADEFLTAAYVDAGWDGFIDPEAGECSTLLILGQIRAARRLIGTPHNASSPSTSEEAQQ
jgi:hypothetical protein